MCSVDPWATALVAAPPVAALPAVLPAALPAALLTAALLSAAARPAAAADLVVDQANGNSPASVTGGSPTYGTLTVGNTTSGTLNQSGGSITATTALVLGNATAAVGTYNLGGGTLVSHGGNSIGLSGNGAFNLTAGTFDGAGTAFTLVVGQNAKAQGAVTLGGTATFLGYSEFVGGAGTGTFTQNGGTHTVGFGITLGGSGGAGTYDLNGGTLTTPQVAVGSGTGSGTGTFDFNGGTLQAAASSTSFLVGACNARIRNGGAVFDTNGHNVTVAWPLSHSTLAGDNAFDGGLSKNGAGTLTLSAANTYTGDTHVSAGTLAVTGSLGAAGTSSLFIVDGAAAASATGNLSGTGALYSANTIIGNNASGYFEQSGGSHNVGLGFYVGQNAGSSGTFNLDGGTLVSHESNSIGFSGRGSFNLTAGTFDGQSTSHTLTVGQNTGAGGSVYLSGTALFQGYAEVVGYQGTGSFTQVGGTHTISLSLALGGAGGTGTYELNGGTLALGSGGLTLGGTTSAGGTGTFYLEDGLFDAGRSTLALGAYAGNSSLNMTGGTLQNAAAIKFPLNQKGGTLEAGKPGVPAVTTITGDGTTAYTLGDGFHAATLLVEIDGAAAFDQVRALAGLVTLNGGNLSVHESVGHVAPVGAQFAVLTSGTPITGTFAQGALVTSDTGQLFAIVYNTTPAGTSGYDVVLTALPEPAGFSALSLAAAAGLLRRRRARRRMRW